MDLFFIFSLIEFYCACLNQNLLFVALFRVGYWCVINRTGIVHFTSLKSRAKLDCYLFRVRERVNPSFTHLILPPFEYLFCIQFLSDIRLRVYAPVFGSFFWRFRVALVSIHQNFRFQIAYFLVCCLLCEYPGIPFV